MIVGKQGQKKGRGQTRKKRGHMKSSKNSQYTNDGQLKQSERKQS